MIGENELTVKAVLLGESGVGKTSIISRFIDNSFEKNKKSTTGADYTGKTMYFDEYGGKKIKFEIWDTAGQEIYRSLTKIFYKDAKIAVLVYDITKRETFEELKKYWYNQIKESATPDIIIAIAANKCDLYEDEKVKEEEGREFAKEIGAYFKLTSAFLNSGIEELFKSVGCKLINPNYSEDEDAPSKTGGAQPAAQPQKSNEKEGGKIKLDGKKTKEKKEKKGGFC